MNSIPFMNEDYWELPHSVQVAEAEEWLRDNEGHANYKVVQKWLLAADENIKLKTELEETKAKAADENSILRLKLKETKVNAANETSKLRTQLKNRSLTALIDQKYPTMVDRSLTAPYFPTNHREAEVMSDPIDKKVLSFVNALLTKDFLSAPMVAVADTDCDSENCVLIMVTNFLKAVVSALNLTDVVQVVPTRTLAGVECDVLLVYKPNRLPFATLEVKKPGRTSEHRRHIFFGDDSKGGNRVAGQIYDQMMALKLFGFQKVFGMITCWNHWRLVSTSSSEKELDLNSLRKKSVESRELGQHPKRRVSSICRVS
jgi:hypothetical protein